MCLLDLRTARRRNGGRDLLDLYHLKYGSDTCSRTTRSVCDELQSHEVTPDEKLRMAWTGCFGLGRAEIQNRRKHQ